MESTHQRKDRLRPPGYTNGGTHIPLGSEGSSRESEGSSGEGHLPDTVDITVILPDSTSQQLTVDYGKQMMDFLVQVSASNKLSPATHTFHLFSEETGRPLEYYPSMSVGAVGIGTFHLVQKKSELQRKKERQKQQAQPFEVTQRLTVNLPRNQKMLTRVSPKCTLAEIFKLVCGEKNLDPYKYELRHPTRPDAALNMASPLGDYSLSEITVVSVGPEARSNSDFSLDTSDFSSPRASRHSDGVGSSLSGSLTMEKKKKKGFLSLFSKRKEGKFKPNEATYSESTSTLPTSSKASLSSPSFVDSSHQNSSTKRATSLNHIDQTVHSEPGTSKSPAVTNNNNVQKGVPSKPPRHKKRQAPLPPTTKASPRQPPSSASVSSSSPQDPLALRSRTSSHSSGFESAGSPHIDSPRERVAIETSGNSLRAVNKAQIQTGVKPKVTTTMKKKRPAPRPPGVSRLRLGSDGSAPSEAESTTPASTPRYNHQDHTLTSGEAGPDDQPGPLSITSSLTESPRPRPVFTAPPPPDTPPPPEVVTLDNLEAETEGTEVISSVSDSSTQVHVNVRDSLSSERLQEYEDSTELGSRQNSLNLEMTETFSAHSRSGSACSENTLHELSVEFDSVIALATQILGDTSQDPILPLNKDPGMKADVSVFTERMSSLTENIEDSYTSTPALGQQPVDDDHRPPTDHMRENTDHRPPADTDSYGHKIKSADDQDPDESFTKDSLQEGSISSDSVSVDNYDFGNEDKEQDEPALPDLDTSVVLVKKTSLNEDSFYSNSNVPLSESKEREVGACISSQEHGYEQMNNNNNEKLNMSEEISSPIDLVSHSSFEKPRGFSINDDNLDRFSVDSLDMINSATPTSDSGFSGSLERNTSGQEVGDPRLSVTEEITIDQSEVMYIAPGGPKPDLVLKGGEEKEKPELKPEQIVKPELKPEQVKMPELKPEQVKIPELKPEHTEMPEMKPEKIEKSELKPEKIEKSELKPEQMEKSEHVQKEKEMKEKSSRVLIETESDAKLHKVLKTEKEDVQTEVKETKQKNKQSELKMVEEIDTRKKDEIRERTEVRETKQKDIQTEIKSQEVPRTEHKSILKETDHARDTSDSHPQEKTKDQHPTVFIIEKTKLKDEIRKRGAQEPPKEKPKPSHHHQVTSISNTLADKSLDPDFRKFLSYVESAKQKTGEVGYDGPVSPDAKTAGTSFFVDFEETKPASKPHKAALQSQSLDSFSTYSTQSSKPDAFSYGFPERRESRKPDFRITTLEYKPEAKPDKNVRMNSLRDAYHRPVGKSPSLESEESRPKYTYSAVPSSPSYSFYKTDVKTETPKKDQSKRNSTVIMMRKDEKQGPTQPRRSGLFMGPRPYGAKKQTSEPSVRDVRKALSIYEAKVDSESTSSKGSNRGSPTKDMDNGDVRERVSKIGFSPSGEQESDSVLEEKSISQIALPAQRRVISKSPQPSPNYSASALQLSRTSDSMENLSGEPGMKNNATTSNTNSEKMSNNSKKLMTKSTESLYDKDKEREKSRKTLQSQYDDLQTQFSKWQTQLMLNQSLLSERSPNKVDTDPTGQPSRRGSGQSRSSEFNRRSTIDVVESHSLPQQDEVERRGRMFDRTDQRGATGASPTTRLEELKFRRHQGGRYSSLTEGVTVAPPVAANAALGSKFSQQELEQARVKLRQNSTEERGGHSTRYNADNSSSTLIGGEKHTADTFEYRHHDSSSNTNNLGRSGISRSEYKTMRETGSSLGHATSPERRKSDYDVSTGRNMPRKTESPLQQDRHKMERSAREPLSGSLTGLSQSKPQFRSVTGLTQSDLEKSRGSRFARQPRQRRKIESGDGGARFEPKLDPREELMIAIRSAGGRNVLRTVTVDETKWMS